MLDPRDIPEVTSEERLARYILHRRHVRQDNTLRPNAFIPHPYQELSVTRHRGASDDELWMVGVDVSVQTGKTLCGRGDLTAFACLAQELRVVAAPVEGNSNHANVVGWPEKPAQKLIAQELAARADFVRVPPEVLPQ